MQTEFPRINTTRQPTRLKIFSWHLGVCKHPAFQYRTSRCLWPLLALLRAHRWRFCEEDIRQLVPCEMYLVSDLSNTRFWWLLTTLLLRITRGELHYEGRDHLDYLVLTNSVDSFRTYDDNCDTLAFILLALLIVRYVIGLESLRDVLIVNVVFVKRSQSRNKESARIK